ncbi:MAG: hypothetical protein E7476_00320 [Ruminococcaceae bacterium]|nr:hypothetical protein [Oscillospiraceae bacterium]
MRSDWLFEPELQHILGALTTENRLACEISRATGLRIWDVLALTREQAIQGRFTVQEQKTGKNRRVSLPKELQRRALLLAGDVYVFPHRYTGKRHRTRQAVYKDLKRAARLFRCRENITPHSLRKGFAVAQFHNTGDMKRVQHLLNHSDEAVTMLYAMADEITQRKYTRRARHGKKNPH